MSNGFGWIGTIANESGSISVGEWWTSGDGGLELSVRPAMPDLIGEYVRLTDIEARELRDLLNTMLEGGAA